MKVPVLLAIGAMALWPSLGRAADAGNFTLKTTEDLYAICSAASTSTGPMHTAEANFCEGYVLGIVSYHDAIADRRHMKRLFCYPQTVTRDQAVQAFVDWAASHQQDRKFMNDPPVKGVVRSLAHQWPCA